jgi:hypothetical protein
MHRTWNRRWEPVRLVWKMIQHTDLAHEGGEAFPSELGRLQMLLGRLKMEWHRRVPETWVDLRQCNVGGTWRSSCGHAASVSLR